jgi:hypothetical protein
MLHKIHVIRYVSTTRKTDPYKSHTFNIVFLYATFVYLQVKAGGRSDGTESVSLVLSTSGLNLRYLVARYSVTKLGILGLLP